MSKYIDYGDDKIPIEEALEKMEEEISERDEEIDKYREILDKIKEYIEEHIRIDDEYPDYMEMLVDEYHQLLELLEEIKGGE